MDCDGYTFRFGEADDIPAIRDFILDAGAGLFEYMLDRALPGVSARQLIKLAVADPDANLSYRNALVADHPEHGPAGIALCYPAKAYGIPPIVESIVPRKRLEPLRPFLTEKVPGTLYLNTLAVAPQARGCALGSTLVDLTLEWAAELGYRGVTLHVWQENDSAVAMYRNRGFEAIGSFDLPVSGEFRYSGPVILLHTTVD